MPQPVTFEYQCYTDSMKDGCGCMPNPQEQAMTVDLKEAVARGKRERQAVLQRVRRQRALLHLGGLCLDDKPGRGCKVDFSPRPHAGQGGCL
jgi:hypothetical protein